VQRQEGGAWLQVVGRRSSCPLASFPPHSADNCFPSCRLPPPRPYSPTHLLFRSLSCLSKERLDRIQELRWTHRTLPDHVKVGSVQCSLGRQVAGQHGSWAASGVNQRCISWTGFGGELR